MDTAQILVIATIVLGFVVLYFLLRRDKTTDNNETFLELFKSMQQRMDVTNETLNKTIRETQNTISTTLSTNTDQVNKRLDNAAKVIGDVQKNLGEMGEIGRSMQDIQAFLQSPKLRGNIGEQVLKELLGQMLPKQTFHLQYGFKSGSVVDAAIKTDAGIIPIDSKFPMENFRKINSAKTEEASSAAKKAFEKDVKKHILDISKKYILTDEGTIDYALMYVPSEAVYYEIVNSTSLYEYSGEMRVLPVSPATFYAYLRTVMISFEGQKISAKAREVLASLRAIQKEHGRLGDDLSKLSRHVQNSYNMMSSVQGGYDRLGQRISSTNAIEVEEKKQVE